MRVRTLLIGLAIFSTRLVAQDYSTLPELPIWYQIDNVSSNLYMCSLPDFDTAKGGNNALVLTYGNSNSFCLYTRFQGDTNTMFRWSDPVGSLYRGDFDGDGRDDYFSNGGVVYKGLGFGIPPQLPKYWGGFPYSTRDCAIVDINGDGLKDIITTLNGHLPTQYEGGLGSIILGANRLSQMQVMTLPFVGDTSKSGPEHYQCMIDAYSLGAGKARIITWSTPTWPPDGTLTIWDVQIKGQANSQTIQYTRLGTLRIGSQLIDDLLSFHLKNNSEHTIKIGLQTFSINNDQFDFINSDPMQSVRKIDRSIADLSMPGWFWTYTTPDSVFALSLGGDPRVRHAPYARLVYSYNTGNGNMVGLVRVVSIGDINGDGIGDIAAYYGGEDKNGGIVSKLVFYLGRTGTMTIPANTDELAPILNCPNPVSGREVLRVQIVASALHSAQLTLYNLRGEKVAVLWDGSVASGSSILAINLSAFGIPSGMYDLRLTTGKNVVDKALIITD